MCVARQLFHRELGEYGFSGVEVRRGQMKTEIIIRAARAQDVLGASASPHVVAAVVCVAMS